jgi:hypothetical protein
MLTEEGREKALKEYSDKCKIIASQIATCRYCKSARTRTNNLTKKCKRHDEALRIAYCTSPISETYWAT